MKLPLLLLICLNISVTFSKLIVYNFKTYDCAYFDTFVGKYGYSVRDLCCKDNRIKCDENDYFTEINLTFKEVQTMDFSSFPILTRLKKLNLSGDIFKNYTVPAKFFDLPSLNILDLSKTNVAYIADNIKIESPVTEIYLQNNRIKSLPTNFIKLSNLKILNLNYNHLYDLHIPHHAIKLDVQHNLLETIVVDFANFPMEELNLSENNFYRDSFDEIVWLEKLKKLDVSMNSNLKSVPEGISKLNQLEELNMSSTQISSLPEEIFQLSNLNYFDISDNPELNTKIKKFGNIVNQCNFLNTNIECYSENACSSTNGEIGEISYSNCEPLPTYNYDYTNTYGFEDNNYYNNYKNKDEKNNSNRKNIIIFSIIGIVSFILLLIVIITVCCCISRKRKSKKNDEKLKSLNPGDDSSTNDNSSNPENNSSPDDNSSNLEEVSSSFSDKTLNDTISEVENEKSNIGISFSNASKKDEESLLKNKSLSINNNSDKKGSNNNELKTGIKSLDLNDNNDIDVVVDVSISNNSEKKKEIIVREPQIDSYTPTAPPSIDYELPAAPITIPSNIEPTAPPSIDINNNNNQDQRITVNDPIMDDSIQEVILSPKMKESVNPTPEISYGHNQRNSVSDPIIDDSIQEKVLSRTANDSNDNHNNIKNNDNNDNINDNNNNINNDNNNNNNYNNYNVNNGSINVNNAAILPPYTIPTIQSYFENNSNEQNIHNVGSICSPESFSYISGDQNFSVQLSNSIYSNNDNVVSNNNSVLITTNDINTSGDNDNDNNNDDNNGDIVIGECTILPSYSELLRNHIIRRPSYQD